MFVASPLLRSTFHRETSPSVVGPWAPHRPHVRWVFEPTTSAFDGPQDREILAVGGPARGPHRLQHLSHRAAAERRASQSLDATDPLQGHRELTLGGDRHDLRLLDPERPGLHGVRPDREELEWVSFPCRSINHRSLVGGEEADPPTIPRRNVRRRNVGAMPLRRESRYRSPAQKASTIPITAAIAALARAFLERRRRPSGARVSGAEVTAVRVPRSKARSRADWKRSEGCFSRQCATMRSRAGEVCRPLSESGGGSLFRIALMVSAGVSPRKARLLVRHFVDDGAEREDVRAVVGLCAADLLRRHVPRCSNDDSGLAGIGECLVRSRLSFCDLSRQAEVEDLDEAVLGEEQVLGLQVPVDHAPLVRGEQTPRAISRGDLGGASGRDRAVVEPLAQRLAVEQLHDCEGDAIGGSEIVDREDVGVGKGRNGSGLALEAGEGRRVGGHIFGKHLDGDFASELRIPCAVDLAHLPRRAARGFRTSPGESRPPGACEWRDSTTRTPRKNRPPGNFARRP